MRPRNSSDAPGISLIITLAISILGLTWPCNAWAGTEKVLYAFQGGDDAWEPQGPLVFDKAGNIYGTGFFGGTGCGNTDGCGAVYKLTKSKKVWTESLIYNFTGASDGSLPVSGLVFDKQGNLYGATQSGGNSGCYEGQGCGAVFELTLANGTWSESTLHTFSPNTDGGGPLSPLALDKAGNIYGTARWGGLARCYFGCGVVFELSPSDGSWNESVLYSFTDGVDGADPVSTQLLYKNNLYGAANPPAPYGLGGVFELQHSKKNGWQELNLYSFTGGTDGAYPYGGVVLDSAGNIYGTTFTEGAYGYGNVFKLTRSGTTWTKTIIYSFTGGSDGGSPWELTLDKTGDLYGTADVGGLGYGVVFELVNSGGTYAYKNVYTFTGGADGANPAYGNLTLRGGKLYGSTPNGGTNNFGVVYEITP